MSTHIPVRFRNQAGDYLVGHLHLPEGQVRAYAVYAPCFTCGKDVHAARRISQGLADRGIGTLRIDFTGLGESEGNFEDTNFTTNVSDIKSAAAFLAEHYQKPEIVLGHSLGGTAAIVAASQMPYIKAVSTINSPCHPRHVAKHFVEVEEKVLWEGEAEFALNGRPFRIQKHFFEELKKYDMEEVFKELRAAILVFHAPHDDVVNIRSANAIFELANHPKSFISLDSADHLIRDRRDADFIAASIAAWASRYIQFDIPKAQPLAAAHGQVIVASTDEGKYTHRIYAGSNILRADEPTTVAGGLGTGPSPYELLLSALGACTSMTLRMYADLKQIPLEQVTVRLTHTKIPGEDPAKAMDQIERFITLTGKLSQDQKEKLLEIANKCPVHKTLRQSTLIKSSLESDTSHETS